jgi:ABC-type branched-subunit amino acid transport system substrate-binding protein
MRPWRYVLAGLLLAVLGLAAPRDAAAATPRSAREADALASGARSAARDRDLAAWARRASLEDLMFVLRRDPASLGGAEVPLVSAALDRTHRSRADLRRRLMVRLAIADRKRARRLAGELAGELGGLGVRPYASAFRIGALLPDSGDYAGYGRIVRLGIEVALARQAAAAPRPVTIEELGTGSDQPGRAAAAFARAADRCGAVIGELLSVPTIAFATASRATGLPVVSPTATDEDIGTIAPGVFQVGPSDRERGAALARAMLADGPARLGMLLSADHEGGSLAAGFLEESVARGAELVWTEHYAPGTRAFRELVRALLAARVEVLLWNGDSREADAMVREIARQRGHVRICGTTALAPEQFHAETRRLLEGVRYAGDDWLVPAPERAALDSALDANGVGESRGLALRGWLAARALLAAVEGGALAPAEIAAALERRVSPDAWSRERRFLDGRQLGFRVPIHVIAGGRGALSQ